MKKLVFVLLILALVLPAAAQEVSPYPEWTEYDAFIKEIKSTTDFAERAKMMHEAEDMLMETGAILPIYYYNDSMQIKNWPLEGLVVEKHVESTEDAHKEQYYRFRVSILKDDGSVNTEYNEKNGDDQFVNGSVEFELMVENVAITLSVEVEISVIGKVDNGGLIRPCSEIEFQGVILAPLVPGDDFKIAGITRLTILGEIHELHGVSSYPAIPDLVLETLRTSVKMVGTIVDRKGIFHTFQCELAFGDTVSESSWAFSGARAVGEIAFSLRIAENDIRHLSVLVRNSNRDDSGPDT